MTGLVVPDYSGRGWNATISGADWISAEYGPALQFDGVVDYAATPDLQNWITVQTPVTFEAFANITDTSGDWNARGLMCWRASVAAGGQPCGLYWLDAPGQIGFQVCAGNTHASSEIAVAAAGWHHFVGTYDGTNQYLYVDGVLKDSDAQSGALDGFDFGGGVQELYFGISQIGTHELGCDIALTRLYGRYLSATEVPARYQLCLQRQQRIPFIWPLARAAVPSAPPAGQPMHLRAFNIPHMRQWQPRAFR